MKPAVGAARTVRVTLFGLILLLLPLGCSDQPKYAPPKALPADQAAVVKVTDMEVTSVDGAQLGMEALRAYGQQFSVEPGDRQLQVKVVNAFSEVTFAFKASFAAGHHYKLTPERRKVSYFRPVKNSFVLTDETAGTVEHYPKP